MKEQANNLYHTHRHTDIYTNKQRKLETFRHFKKLSNRIKDISNYEKINLKKLKLKLCTILSQED